MTARAPAPRRMSSTSSSRIDRRGRRVRGGRAGLCCYETLNAAFFASRADFTSTPGSRLNTRSSPTVISDHARFGSKVYLTEKSGEDVVRARVGADASIQTLPYGETLMRNGVKISLHPAGHVLGSAQVRMEYKGEVCVASGDYKTENDDLCQPFEVVRCHTFVTESTFGLPIYRWPAQRDTFAQLNQWWAENQRAGWTSVLYCYALGKAQRLLSGLDGNQGPIFFARRDRTIHARLSRGGREVLLTPRTPRRRKLKRRAGAGWCLLRLRRTTRRGCGSSATFRRRSLPAGCKFAARAGGVHWTGDL